MVVVLTLLGFASIAYGVAIMMVGSGTWFFAFWYVLAAVLFGLAFSAHVGVWDMLPIAARRVLTVLACILAIGFALTQICVASGFSQRGEDDLDCIVVLGAQVFEDGPSQITRYRLDEAADYLQRNGNTRCIVSGGQGPSERAVEADVMADYLISKGIDPSRITRERESLNTSQNLQNCLAYIDAENERVGIVTNDFHVFRGCGIARKKGYAHVCGIAAYSHPAYLLNNAVRESFGIAKDFLVGNL